MQTGQKCGHKTHSKRVPVTVPAGAPGFGTCAVKMSQNSETCWEVTNLRLAMSKIGRCAVRRRTISPPACNFGTSPADLGLQPMCQTVRDSYSTSTKGECTPLPSPVRDTWRQSLHDAQQCADACLLDRPAAGSAHPSRKEYVTGRAEGSWRSRTRCSDQSTCTRSGTTHNIPSRASDARIRGSRWCDNEAVHSGRRCDWHSGRNNRCWRDCGNHRSWLHIWHAFDGEVRSDIELERVSRINQMPKANLLERVTDRG